MSFQRRELSLAVMTNRQGRIVAAVAGAAVLCCVCGLPCARGGAEEIAEILEPIRVKYDLPALAGAVILDGRVRGVGATGFRKAESKVRVTSADKFHLGSCTKAMTATLAGILIERGKLDWDTKVAEALPEVADSMHPGYEGITLRHLLAHRAGLAGANQSWPKGKTFLDMHNLPGSTTQQRLAYAKMMLSQEPAAEPGSKYVYSNAGYSILGLIAEKRVGKRWEDLIREEVFEPLRMRSAGFGAMGRVGQIEEPWQHRLEGDEVIAVGPGRLSDNPPVLGPGGTVHCSMGDWAKFVLAHLKGPRGESKLLKAETFKALHTPAFGGDYAGGWILTKRDWGGGTVLTHTGSNNMNFAVVWMAAKRDFAVLIASNQGGDRAAKGCDEAAWGLISKFLLAK